MSIAWEESGFVWNHIAPPIGGLGVFWKGIVTFSTCQSSSAEVKISMIKGGLEKPKRYSSKWPAVNFFQNLLFQICVFQVFCFLLSDVSMCIVSQKLSQVPNHPGEVIILYTCLLALPEPCQTPLEGRVPSVTDSVLELKAGHPLSLVYCLTFYCCFHCWAEMTVKVRVW